MDLWIGDWLRSKISGKIGKFEGMASNGKLRVNVDGKIILMNAEKVEVVDEPKYDPQPKTNQNVKSISNEKPQKERLAPVIDLHIEILAPEFERSEPVEIRNYQLKACKHFIDNAYSQGLREIKIIHGKGEGRLKEFVHNMLKSDKRVNFISENLDGGSTVVLFKY